MVRFSRSLLFLLLSLPLATGIPGCSSSKSSGDAYLDRIGVSTLDFDRSIAELAPELVVNRAAQNRAYVGLLASGSPRQPNRLATMNTIESASFVVIDESGGIIDSLYTDEFEVSGLGGPDGGSIMAGGVEWYIDEKVPDSFTLITIVRSGDRFWLRQARTTLPIMAGFDPIRLELDIEPRSGGGLMFELKAERVDEKPVTEHLPSDEEFRITVFDGPNVIWSSSDGKTFENERTDVEPDEIGERREWTIEWDGTATTGGAAPSGTVTIEARIPTRPSPYVIRKDYVYGGGS